MKLPTSRTFQRNGKWVHKPQRTEVLTCSCGNKYIKTRDRQKECLRCLSKAHLTV